MKEPAPQSPFTELAAAAVQLHEMFRAFLDAGFTEYQALQLAVAIIVRGGAA